VTPETALPAGYILRHPTPDDLLAAAACLAIVTATASGAPDFPEEDLRSHWGALDLDADAWLIIAPDDTVAGYAALHGEGHVVLQAEGYVHPSHTGRGLGSSLLQAAESHASAHVSLAPPGAQVLLYNATPTDNLAARDLLEHAGYTAVRSFWRMIIDLNTAPPIAWPDGITIRTWRSADDDYPFYLALEETFQDHWGHIPADFDVWRRKGERFDPDLWFLASDAAEIVGVLVARHHLDMGWVEQLGVRRPWRQRGIGLALLRQAFVTFSCRGWTQAGLDVDTASETGATRLYERAGMRRVPGQATTLYRKELQRGQEDDRPATVD
jgi:mycothiol synthase